jgi:glycosyltransferase involved in cell wall biosynthesis
MSAQPISVLYFTNTDARGGAEEHMLTLLRGLDRTHFRLHLVCPPEVAEMLRPDLPADVELLPLCLRRPSQVGAAIRLGQIMRERRVDILHSHLFYGSLFASPVGWLCCVPVVLETPHLSERWRQGWFKSRFVIDRFVGRFVDYYIAVSEANACYLSEEKGLPSKKIVVIHNGCDLARFAPYHRPPAGLKANLGFQETDPVLVVTARLEPQKGHRVLLRSLQIVRREFPQVRLVCLGEGSLRGDLESQVRELGLQDSVRFLGYQSDVLDWLALADLTVLPSLWEGLPLAAIESLAARRAVVATAVDGTPEVVIGGKTGITVPPGDPGRLAEAICHLLREPLLRERMAEAGRKSVVEHFSQERQIRQTQELYLSAWEQHQRGVRPVLQKVGIKNEAHTAVPTAGHTR